MCSGWLHHEETTRRANCSGKDTRLDLIFESEKRFRETQEVMHVHT